MRAEIVDRKGLRAEIVDPNGQYGDELYWFRQDWQPDPLGAILLARAMLKIGEVLPGWCGREPKVAIQRARPGSAELQRGQWYRRVLPAPAYEAWCTERNLVEALRDRFWQAKTIALDALRYNLLITRVLPWLSGPLSSLHPRLRNLWDTSREINECRLAYGVINLAHLSDTMVMRPLNGPLYPQDDHYHYLFVDEKSLDQLRELLRDFTRRMPQWSVDDVLKCLRAVAEKQAATASPNPLAREPSPTEASEVAMAEPEAGEPQGERDTLVKTGHPKAKNKSKRATKPERAFNGLKRLFQQRPNLRELPSKELLMEFNKTAKEKFTLRTIQRARSKMGSEEIAD